MKTVNNTIRNTFENIHVQKLFKNYYKIIIINKLNNGKLN